jgi:hypothetical protein
MVPWISLVCLSLKHLFYRCVTQSVADRSLSLFGTGSKNIRTMLCKMHEMLRKNYAF